MEPTIGAEDRIFGEIQVAPDYKEAICFIESLKKELGPGNKYSIECGYKQAVSAIPFITSLQAPGSNMSYLHRQLCLPSRESGAKRISAMPV